MKALIVEDDKILSNNICESLKHKFEMTQAFDGEEGLERVFRERFDVVILDVMMPKLNGYEVVEQMRSGGLTVPVLMLTALGQASDQVKGLRAGSDFESEFQMAMINRKINPNLDTMFLTAEHQYMYMSSSVVKELGHYQVDLSDFLPEQIISDVEKRVATIYQGGNRK